MMPSTHKRAFFDDLGTKLLIFLSSSLYSLRCLFRYLAWPYMVRCWPSEWEA